MRSNNKRFVPVAMITFILTGLCCLLNAEAFDLFRGEINADDINIRADSTITSEIISKINKNDKVIVVSEAYDWYKIRLPKDAPAFIKKNFCITIDEKTVKITKNKVNIRLHPAESSPIIGRIDNKDEIINITENSGEWYKIVPVADSFGWIHKKFVAKIIEEITPQNMEKETTQQSAKNGTIQQTFQEKDSSQTVKITEEDLSADMQIIAEGIIEPYGKFWKRKATHKLVTSDNKVFLLKGSKEQLKTFTRQKVRITGKLIADEKQKYPVIEILNMENLIPVLQS